MSESEERAGAWTLLTGHGHVLVEIARSPDARIRDIAAVAGLTDCWTQTRVNTPKPVWNPDVPQTIDFFGSWQKMPNNQAYDNAFKVQWELFLRHIVKGDPFPWSLLEGAKGVQLAELGLKSWAERKWVDVPKLG